MQKYQHLRFLSLTLALLLLALPLAACGEAKTNPTDETTAPTIHDSGATTAPATEPTTVPVADPGSNPTENPSNPTTAPTTEPVTYTQNLPDDIILSIGEISTSVIGKRGKDIYAELDIQVYAEQTMYAEADFPNGIPYDLWCRGEDTEGWTFVTLGEWFTADKTDVFLRTVIAHFGAFGCPDISLLGIANGASEHDLFTVLGSPDETIDARQGTDTHYWRDLKIGKTLVEYISADVSKDTVTKLTVTFADPASFGKD